MLDLTTATKQAIHSDEISTYNLFEVYYEPDAWESAITYGEGAICRYGAATYECLQQHTNIVPPSASYWAVVAYPFCMTDRSDIVNYDSNAYLPWPIKCGEVKTAQDGKIQSTILSVGNIDESRFVQRLVEQHDLIGKYIKTIQFFEGINDPIATTFRISGAKATKGQVDFTLSVGFDFLISTVPHRTMHQRICRWVFKDSRCKYTGGDTECDRLWEDCKDNKNNIINFGGFPGIMNDRFYF